MFIIIGLVYLLLSCPIIVRICAGVNGIQSSVQAEICYLGLCLRYDGIIKQEKAGAAFRSVPRYIKKGRKDKTGNQAETGRRKERLRRFKPYLAAVMDAGDFRRMDLYIRLGLDDAAHTAVAVGACRAVLSSVLTRFTGKPQHRLCVSADFSAPCFLMVLRCIFSAAPGDIMLAVVKAALRKKRREGSGWISIPLRA